MVKSAEIIHQEAIVIDATCPLAHYGNYFEKWIAGGATAIAPTVAVHDDFVGPTMRNLGVWFKRLRDHSDRLLQVTTVDDIYRAKNENKLGIIFHFQGTIPLEFNLNMIEIYYRLGVRMIQLCYNVKNFVGDGCEERTDCGLSHFGVKAITEMNRLGIVVDLAHTGYKTTMEAIEVSKKPVIISHGNPYGVHNSYRNLKDDQIKAVAAKGGVIGINGYPAFVAPKIKPTLDDLIDHVDYLSRLVGVEHISLGIDYYQGMAGVANDEEAKAMYDQFVQSGHWDPKTYPPPPYHYPEGIEMPDKLPNLTAALLRRGYSEEDVHKIMGSNLIRVFKEVWV
jgi:membrane dipeptidase